jgi:hypothetical protein
MWLIIVEAGEAEEGKKQVKCDDEALGNFLHIFNVTLFVLAGEREACEAIMIIRGGEWRAICRG